MFSASLLLASCLTVHGLTVDEKEYNCDKEGYEAVMWLVSKQLDVQQYTMGDLKGMLADVYNTCCMANEGSEDEGEFCWFFMPFLETFN